MFIEKRQVLVEQALISAFIDADKHYITESILSHLLNGDGAERCISGSCVVVSFIENGYLYVANTGDCRAILGTLVSEDSTLSPGHEPSF
jgi:serine/threonine protein phosphatase PrpC